MAMKKYFCIGIALVLLMAIALVGYGAYLNYSDENQISRRMDERRLEVAGAEARLRDFRPVIDMDAVRLYSESMADAIALMDGRITGWYVGKNSGVRKGDILLTISNDQLPLKIQQANSAVRKAEAVLAQSANSYHRQERLMAKNATSQEKFEEAEAQYRASQEALSESEAQLQQLLVQSDQLNVEAPIDGDVLIVYHREGSYVKSGTPLALVGNFDFLHFSTTLPDEASRHLRIGDTATMRFPDRALQKAYDTEYAAGNLGLSERIEAKLVSITPSPDEPAGVRRIVWEIDNRARILEPLTYNGVSMEMNRAYPCLTIPLEAMADSSHDTVFVVEPDGTVRRRKISTGADNGKQIEVYDGLEDGEVVVVESFDGLEDGMRVDISLEGGTD